MANSGADAVDRLILWTVAEIHDGLPGVMGSVKALDSRYVHVNQGFADHVGRTCAEVVGCRAHDLFPAELADTYVAQDAAVLATGEPLHDHLELIVRRDGTTTWHVTSKVRLVNERGRAIGVAATSIDQHVPADAGHAGVAEAVAAVRGDVARPWRIGELAAIAGLSPGRLDRIVRRTFGLPPSRLVQRLRLEAAAHLLLHTDLALASIASRTGFYDQSALTRQLKASSGMTPATFRQHGPVPLNR
jgi:PAS domain S-box-containing protein